MVSETEGGAVAVGAVVSQRASGVRGGRVCQ
jgi:hypothetical protein